MVKNYKIIFIEEEEENGEYTTLNHNEYLVDKSVFEHFYNVMMFEGKRWNDYLNVLVRYDNQEYWQVEE